MSRQEPPERSIRIFFAAWRTIRLGNREFIDALVRDDHRGPSAALRAALRAWPGAHYWIGRGGQRVVLVRPMSQDPSPRWSLHLLLLLLTLVSTLGAGAALAGAWYPWSGPGLAGALDGAGQFVVGMFEGEWRSVVEGWSFALPLLAILLVHEMGHYLAARRYAIQVTPPFFLPMPPNLSPIGSLGAFISLRSAVLDRRQLLDVGAAGPLAGFVVALGVLVWGYLVSERIPVAGLGETSFILFAGQPIHLGESLVTELLRQWLQPGTGALHLSLPAFAGWVGVFITGLNLLPLSQLDGGHVVYGLIGRRQAAVGLLTVGLLLYLAQFTWMWYIWIVATFLIGRGRWTHPSVIVAGQPVPASRRWIGVICILVFGATFMPIPFGR